MHPICSSFDDNFGIGARLSRLGNLTCGSLPLPPMTFKIWLNLFSCGRALALECVVLPPAPYCRFSTSSSFADGIFLFCRFGDAGRLRFRAFALTRERRGLPVGKCRATVLQTPLALEISNLKTSTRLAQTCNKPTVGVISTLVRHYWANIN